MLPELSHGSANVEGLKVLLPLVQCIVVEDWRLLLTRVLFGEICRSQCCVGASELRCRADSILPLFYPRRLLPFLTFGCCSSLHYFVLGTEVSRPHCLINVTSY